MDEDAAGEQEERAPDADKESAARPSLSERLLGVTTMEELNSAYTSTSARSLIERLTATEKRAPAAEPQTNRTLEDRIRLASRLRIDIPRELRTEDAAPAVEERAEPEAPAAPPPVQDAYAPPAAEPILTEEALVEAIAEPAPRVETPAPPAEPKVEPKAEPKGQDRAPRAQTATAAPPPAAATAEPEPQAEAPAQTEAVRVPNAAELARVPLRVGPGPLEGALQEVNRFIRLRYYVLLTSVALVFGLAIVGGIAMLIALLGDSSWQVLAITAGLEAVALVALVALLMFLQHEPSLNATPSSTEVAQLETARAYLNKSFEFWEKYLDEREQNKSVTAEDVALAVSSLTAASHSLLDLEAGLVKMTQKPKEPARPQTQTPVPTSPTRPTVRSRPSRY